jgi:tetratricopeptide (TPR) repeat protein
MGGLASEPSEPWAFVLQHAVAMGQLLALPSCRDVAMENRLYPMRELLGDMLMENGQVQEALTEYEHSMKTARERLRGHYGAAKAAEALGDKEKATNYFQHLIRLTKDADTERPEIREAKQRIAAR